MPKNRIPIDIEPVCKSCHWWISDKCINHSELDGTFNNTDESVTLHCFYSDEEYKREDNP